MNTNEVQTKTRVPVSEPAAAAGGTHQPTPVKVWLVDDDDSFRTLLAECLTQHRGIECPRDFRSPDALLSALASKPGPDVLLLDIQMRDRNGLDAIGPIKTLSRDTRVLMLTTCFDSHYRSRALAEGASGYLLKSDSLEQIVEQIRKPTSAEEVRRRRRRKPACMAQPISTPGTPAAKTNGPKWWRRLSSAIGFSA